MRESTVFGLEDPFLLRSAHFSRCGSQRASMMNLVLPLSTGSASKTLICGLLGIPPSNGVLLQSPMHTRSLVVLKRQLIRKKMVKSAKECIKQNATKSKIFEKMHVVFVEMDTTSKLTADRELENLKATVLKHDDGENGIDRKFDPEKHIDAHLHVRVNEQMS